MPVPVQIEQQEMREAGHSAHSSLVVEAEGGRCALTRTDGQGRISLLDAALLSWLASSGQPATEAQEELPPCDGLPPVEQVTVPAGGWALGLRSPALSVEAAGELAVLPVGEDGRWWFVAGTGTAQLAVAHPGAPPTRFVLRFDESLSSLAPVQAVPRGGALAVRLEGPPGEVAVQLADERLAQARIEGAWLVVVGRAPGLVEGVLREGQQPPEPLRIEVGAALPPQPSEVAVAAGKTRRLKVDAPPDSAWIADEKLVQLEVRGRVVMLRGSAPGRTHLVLRQGSDVFLVPLVIGH
jgi:hypothetical protein